MPMLPDVMSLKLKSHRSNPPLCRSEVSLCTGATLNQVVEFLGNSYGYPLRFGQSSAELVISAPVPNPAPDTVSLRLTVPFTLKSVGSAVVISSARLCITSLMSLLIPSAAATASLPLVLMEPARPSTSISPIHAISSEGE